MTIVLDTNVVSELMRPSPDLRVVDWVDQHPSETLFLTSVTVAEILFGVARMPSGARRRRMGELAAELVDREFAGRVLGFDVRCAVEYASVVSSRERRGRPISMADGQIAAICSVHHATLATRNEADFVGTDTLIVNPWLQPAGS